MKIQDNRRLLVAYDDREPVGLLGDCLSLFDCEVELSWHGFHQKSHYLSAVVNGGRSVATKFLYRIKDPS